MQGIDEPTTSASLSRTKAANMSDTERREKENTPLLQIKKDDAGGARFEHAGINDNDQPYINDVTDGMTSPLVGALFFPRGPDTQHIVPRFRNLIVFEPGLNHCPIRASKSEATPGTRRAVAAPPGRGHLGAPPRL